MQTSTYKSNEHGHIGSQSRTLLVLFALSGAAGLIYEVVWMRQQSLILGASTHAVTIVLAAFMCGLGLGAWLLGRIADRLSEDQLARCYILVEAAIGLYALIVPWILEWQQALYVHFHQSISSLLATQGLRLLLAFALFVIPAGLMGATLPIMTRYLVHSRSRIPITVSRLYAVNTLGAVAGVVLAGYVLLPALGNTLTTACAAAGNLLVAGGFWLIHVSRGRKSARPSLSRSSVVAPEERTSMLQKSVIVAFCVSGAAAMLYEVAWTRTLAMILGTTTFAFTTMLATFLLGIALGSVLYGVMRRVCSAPVLFVCLQLAIALSVMVTIPLFGKLPFLYLSLHARLSGSWINVQLLRFFLAALVMVVPTTAMGCVFPVVSDIVVDKATFIGRRLGRAYGYNTFGAVVGTLTAGLLFIPTIGMQRTIVAGAFVNLMAGGIVCLLCSHYPLRYRLTVISAGVVAVTGLLSIVRPWSPKVMSSGVYVYASRYHDLLDRVEAAEGRVPQIDGVSPWQLWNIAMEQYSLLYYKTGQTATVAVMERDDGVRFLTIDGKTDAGSGPRHDMKTQVLLGQLPLLFHPAPDRVFVVGLGSGVTAGSVLTHDVRLVDCAEFSKGVIEASRFFSHMNHDALDDPRLEVIPRDARNLLLTSDRNYDVIISQPSNPWVSGQASLFSLEWYRVVRDHLAKGGIFTQWLPAYHMSNRDVKTIIHTLRSVFPHVTAWTSGAAGELILVARKDQPLTVSYRDFQRRTSVPAVDADIRRIGLEPSTLLCAAFVMNENDIGNFLYADTDEPLEKNTDDRLILEFSTPKQMMRQHSVERFVTDSGLCGDIESLLEILQEVDATCVSPDGDGV